MLINLHTVGVGIASFYPFMIWPLHPDISINTFTILVAKNVKKKKINEFIT